MVSLHDTLSVYFLFFSKDRCFQRIKTTQRGWPWFAEKCYEVQTAKCDKDNEKNGTTAVPESSTRHEDHRVEL